MPSAAARRLYEDQIPSFMSVFDLDAETMADRETVTVVDPKFMEVEPSCAPALPNHLPQPLRPPPPIPSDASHKHHDSTSTQMSGSADSSPTTTLSSTTDSSPLSDPSPSSSPDSPVNLIPLSSFPGTTFGGLPATLSSLTVTEPSPSSASRPMTSPSPRRPRNMKGLSIQPPFAPSTATSLVSEPTSPSFIKPKIAPMKKRPSQLSLKTNSSDLVARTTLEVPNSPSVPPILQRRALKHSTSTPHMLSGLKSSTFGPPGGMCFPKVLERNESGLSELLRPSKLTVPGASQATIVEEESPIRMQVANRGGDIEQLRDESENNEDQKSPGYPDGPIAIYDDDVFLYLEPTAEEASRFDLVINVAREVRNPFENEIPGAGFLLRPTMTDDSPIPDTSVTAASYATAFEYPIPEESTVDTPTTPKATFPPKRPEYIHMLWDHNTDIAPDLMSLCEKIDKAVKEDKKVLIHCQQGASRSASLIIAYGLFRNPELSVNDAYYAAQARSRWISPNMKLMYCLQDFQKEVSKKRQTPGSGFRPRAGRSPTKHRLTLSADAIDIAPKEPLTAPLPGENEEDRGSASPNQSPIRGLGNSTPRSQPISPGPSSAPSSFSWTLAEDQNDPGKFGRFNIDDMLDSKLPQTEHKPEVGFIPINAFARPPPTPGFAPRSFDSHSGFGFAGLSFGQSMDGRCMDGRPVERQITLPGSFPDDSALMSPRVETMTNNPLRDPSFPPDVGMGGFQFVESPPTPSEGLFSPRVSVFPRDPFFPFGRPSQVADPRSPPTKGETPIVRSIDEVL